MNTNYNFSERIMGFYGFNTVFAGVCEIVSSSACIRCNFAVL